MQKPSLSFGLVVYNEAHQIRDLLEQIRDHWHPSFREILIVDNGSTDETLSILGSWTLQNPICPLYIFNSPENNMALARNKILQQATAEWVYFIDADCRLQTDAFHVLLSALSLHNSQKDIGGIGGSARPPDQNHFIYSGLRAMRTTWLGHMNSIQVKAPKQDQFTNLLSTCNFLVRKSAALQVGGCDPQFSRVGEDLSLSHRLVQNDFRLLALKSADIIHHQNPDWKNWYAKMFRYGYAQTHMAWRYPGHFGGLRGAQFVSFLGGVLSLVFFPLAVGGLALSYFVILLLITRNLFSAFFIFSSQATYGFGEIYGSIAAPLRRKNFPKRTPALDRE